jgi:hypothetical protein
MEVCFVVKTIFRRWSLAGLLVLALGVSAGCVTDEVALNADIVLAEIGSASAPAGSIEFESKTLVYSADIADLVGTVRSRSLEIDKRDLVMNYLVLQKRIDCILDDVEEAAKDDATIQCEGKILVAKEGEHGLLGFDEITEEINSREGDPAKRDYLAGYLVTWNKIKRINRVEESLAQIKRSNALPVFGALIKSIHRFPILYEGNELVPRDDIPNLLDQYSDRDTEEAKRTLVIDYLER